MEHQITITKESPIRSEEPQPILESWRKRGWLLPYLIGGDEVFGIGRLTWWLSKAEDGLLPDGPIPQMVFCEPNSPSVRVEIPSSVFGGPPLSAAGAVKHVNELIDELRGGWSSMSYFIDWLHWGLGLAAHDAEAPREPVHGWGEILYRKFQLGRLQASDCDVLGNIISDSKSGSWNPHAFYPTPMHICNLMADMTMDENTSRVASVMDCCVGTGRMLLAASNRSLNLWGMDIDLTMVKVCAINLALFAPWGVYLPNGMREQMERGNGEAWQESVVEKMVEQRKVQGLEVPEKKETTFDCHGQGDLFSLLGK